MTNILENKIEKISVIIPVYNVEEYLHKCLESIICQTYKELEIILVDDGSKDRSGKICDDYAMKDKRCIVIHKQNGGLSSARNVGIEAATGTFIGFVDGDDWIAPTMYENLIGLCQSFKSDIAVGGIIRVKNEEEKIEIDKEQLYVYTQEEFLRKFFRVHTQNSDHYACNKLYKKELFDEVRYPEKLICEDVVGTFHVLLYAKKIIITDYPVYYYRVNPNSITNRKFDESQYDLLTVWDYVLNLSVKNCSEEMQDYARINRYRADFAILCKLAISDFQGDNKEGVKEKKKELLICLRRHCFALMKASIPINRKILIFLFCLNYNIFSGIFRNIYLRKKTKSTLG